ncbi:dynamin family protein [uncultured Haemophilus sp.]|uniref:dynamin family protein n=1 Tax=uncultured Haemophilus sp. TaxID=237779 RepID=UPI00258668DA|nr:dynamin family protein [uncultured Haemophilus sp.]
MINISIKHNPFTVETTFLVDGKQPNIRAFSEFSSQRFQQWIERLFDELNEHFNGAKDFSVEFQGVESDYLDLVSAAEEAKAKGMNIHLAKFTQAENADTRLAKIQNLVDEAIEHPLLKDKINENPRVIEDLEASFNKEFDIYVAATMSSGKSTLINAMLGADLLPAANEATTATIAKIYDTDMPIGEFVGQRFNFNHECVDPAQPVTLETLQDWNKREDTLVIEIEGNVSGMAKRDEVRLVLSDTPGPNNSQTDEHLNTTMKHMKDTKKNPLILYILNATQLGINDDKNTLQMISEIVKSGGKQSKDRFIFVVNKMDMFDPEKGEDINNVLKNVRNYLENNGIENPNIYPVSANLTRLLRKYVVNPDSLSRSERNALRSMEELFNEEPTMDMLQYMNLTKTVKEKLENGKYSLVEKRSGLPAVEKVIDTYIEKYNLPERVFRAYRALDNVIRECSNEAELVKSLDISEKESVELQKQIQQIEKVKSDSSKTGHYIQKLKKEGVPLPEDIVKQVNEIEMSINKKIRDFSESFTGSVDPLTAQRKLNLMKDDVGFAYKNVTTSYDCILDNVDRDMKKALDEEYKKHVKGIFADAEDSNSANLPQLQHMRVQIEKAFIKDLDDEEIDVEQVYSHTEKVQVGTKKVRVGTERVKTGTQRVKTGTERVKTGTKRVKVGERSTSSWWNPFSWGDTENIYEDRDVFEERDVFENRDIFEERDVFEDREVYEDKAVMKDVHKVNLAKLWEKRGKEIVIQFNQLTSAATKRVDEHQKQLVDKYIGFMEEQFNPRVDAIINDLKGKLEKQDELKAEIEKAKRNLNEIDAFKAKVSHVIHL